VPSEQFKRPFPGHFHEEPILINRSSRIAKQEVAVIQITPYFWIGGDTTGMRNLARYRIDFDPEAHSARKMDRNIRFAIFRFDRFLTNLVCLTTAVEW
jgi:hypothetical protein